MILSKKKTLLFCFLCFFGSYIFFYKPFDGQHSYPQRMEIKKGYSVSRIAKHLLQKKIISSSFLFKIYIKIQNLEHKLQQGHYLFKQPLSISELAKILTQGKIETKKITFYEGISSWEIFSLLKQKLSLDSTILENLIVDTSFINKLNLPIISSLEGFLYPDTYLFPLSINEKEVLIIMVKQWKKIFNSLSYQSSKLFQKYGLKKIMIMASIIEKESRVPQERKIISGVFWNRLKQNWSLGADPTVRYALRKLTGSLTTSNLKIKSPYNTRLFKGLTPTPISNPGKQSILASLYPKKHTYMFFVTKDDGSYEHYFSKTNREHVNLKKKRLKNRFKQQ